MKENSCCRCPGCRKACPAERPCCKYGRRYFEKMETENSWKKNTAKGGLLRHFLKSARKLKKALKGKKITEEQVLRRFTPDELLALEGILKKLEKVKAAAD